MAPKSILYSRITRRAGRLWPILLSVIVVSGSPLESLAQPLGTFRWQLQPYCNVVSVAVTQNGGIFRLDGTDDQCGSGDLASVVGTAFQNPDGTIGFGLNIVATPGGAPVHVDAEIALSTLGGTWRDSAGNTGAFIFTPGAGTGGSPRPATGTIGAISINPAQVQLRIGGSCLGGQFMQVINQDGSVTCGAAGGGGGDVTGVAAGTGLAGGGTSGDVTLSLRTIGGAFDFANTNGFVSSGTFGSGGLGISGAGTRVVWYPRKAAFRAGRVDATAWDDANIGNESAAFNKNTRATGTFSAAFGDSTLASGQASTAMGQFTTANGVASVAMGSNTTASGVTSVAMGLNTTANGGQSVAMGLNTTANGAHSIAMGDGNQALGGNSTVFGALSAASGFEAVAMGLRVHANGNGSVALGTDAVALGGAAHGSFIFADRSSATQFISFAPNEFLVRSAGGVGFYTNAALTTGVFVAPGGGSWQTISDANLKHEFRDLSGEDILKKLARMPVREWSYKSQDPSIRHVGPTAQDFHAAFGLGENPLRINTIDTDGIALAAIRALEARTAALIRENERLRERLERLERRDRR